MKIRIIVLCILLCAVSGALAADPYLARRQAMVEQDIKGRGIRDAKVLVAMGTVPRHLFVAGYQQWEAYGDHPLPIDVRGQIIYYTGPSPARPGQVVGSIGPTTGGRMDKFTPKLLALGLKGTLGKGARSQAVKDALRQHRAVYFGAIGGAGAVLSGFVKKLEVVAYEDLGTEAIRRLEVAGFPAIVVNDCHGGDLYQDGMKAFAREGS